MDFIRSGDLCIISTSLSKIYQIYGPYKVRQTLDNFDCPCKKITGLMDFIRSGALCVISTNFVKITGLMDFIKSYRIADFVQYSPALQNLTRLMDFIRYGVFGQY
jgi:hypothetical protein